MANIVNKATSMTLEYIHYRCCSGCREDIKSGSMIFCLISPPFFNRTTLYLYISKFPGIKDHLYQEYCVKCIGKYEEAEFFKMEDSKLPLYVNHLWLTPQGESAFKERLSGVTA